MARKPGVHAEAAGSPGPPSWLPPSTATVPWSEATRTPGSCPAT